MARAWRYLWAAPTTAVGLLVVVMTLLTGGRTQRCHGVLEVWGGLATWLLERTPIRADAMTLGHVVLGRHCAALDRCRTHELVHVRQAEVWGPLFLPAYLAASLIALLTGRHFYFDNRFETEARRIAGY